MRFEGRSLGAKLFFYFTMLAAAILGLLWLLQTVLLESLYEGMVTNELKNVADRLAASGDDTDFEDLLDRAAYDNSILVYVIDSGGTVIYSTDEHESARDKGEKKVRGLPRTLPSDYRSFSKKLNKSPDGRISYILESGIAGARTLVLGAKLDNKVLYISTPLDPLGVTIQILRRQLLYVSVAALFLGLIAAFFISRRFARPVAAITRQAEGLAEGRFPQAFEKGFCSELDHLSDALTYASRELGKVEGLRRDLIANVSHDLRTPLTMIKAYAELIRDISGGNKEKREAHLAVIAAEADRLTELVNDILSLSQVQSGGITLDLREVDLSATVERVISQFEPLSEREGCRFLAEIAPGQIAKIDERRIDQVLYNMIGNAVNHIGEDRTVYVRVKGVPRAVRVEVSDHGEGISDEDLPRIWERYYKAQNHVRAKAGTGLGLSIVKGILEMHGAKYGVISRLGEGSTFWFEIAR